MSYIENEQGLKYKDTTVGTGAEAHKRAVVVVHYTGWLQNADGSVGDKFDSAFAGSQRTPQLPARRQLCDPRMGNGHPLA